MTRKTSVAVLIVALAGGVLLLPKGSVAHPANYWGLWRFNHELCASGTAPGCFDRGNVVTLWQRILYTDNYGPYAGRSAVDGQFGPKTVANTERWQRREGLPPDGIVGRNTWLKAENWIYENAYHQSKNTSTWQYYAYSGLDFDIEMRSRWTIENSLVQEHPSKSGSWYHTSHPGITLTGCNNCTVPITDEVTSLIPNKPLPP